MRKVFFLMLFSVFCFDISRASDTLFLDAVSEEFNLMKYVEYYQDQSASLTLKEILLSGSALTWQKPRNDYLRFGLTSANVWLKTTLANPTSSHLEFVLFITDPAIFRADLYTFSQGKLKKRQTSGISVLPVKKLYRNSKVFFQISIAPGENHQLILKFQSRTFFSLKAQLVKGQKLNNYLLSYRTFLGGIYGIIAFIILNIFILYFSIKRIAFLYFIFYSFFFALLIGCLDGLTDEYFYIILPYLGFRHEIVLASASSVFLILFTMSFLEIRKYVSITYYLGNFFILLNLSVLPLILINAALAYLSVIYVSFGIIILIIWCGVTTYRAGVTAGVYFLSSFFILGLGVFITGFSLLRVLPVNDFTRHSMHISYTLHLVVLSMGLSVRIKKIRDDLLLKELENQQIIKEKNKELEEKVRQRTRELEKKEADLRSLLDSNDASIWFVNDKYQLEAYNRAFEHYFSTYTGKSPALGTDILSLAVDEKHRTHWKKMYDETFKGISQRYSQDYGKGGEPRIIETITYPVIFQGKITGVSVYTRNITNEVIKERELLNLNTNLNAILESTKDIVFALDNQYRYLTFNENHKQAMEAIYGLKIEIGKNILDYMQVHGDDVKAKADIDRALKNGEQYVIEQIYGNESLQRTYFEASYNPIINDQKEISGVAVFVRNMTEKRRSEEIIRESQQLLSSINYNIREGIFRSAPDGRIFYINHAFAKMFGYNFEEEVLHINSMQLYVFPEIREELVRELFQNRSYDNREVLFQRKDGSAFWGLISCILNENEKGELFLDGAIRDISQVKKAEQILKKQNEKLKKINNELDKFVYSASHDLRAPLASLMGLIDISKDENDAKVRNHYFELMNKSVQKLDSFIRQIIQYSRNTRVAVKRSEINFKEMVQTIFENLKFMPEADKIEKKVSILQSMPFYSDEFRLSIILNNLLSNAIRYHNPFEERPYVGIIVEVDDKKATIQVQDNGMGIEKKYIKKIFDMFFKASSNNIGSGLGLYIVKESLNVLKGQIWVESELDKGTVFHIEIPNLKVQQQKKKVKTIQ